MRQQTISRARWLIELKRTARLALPIAGGMLGHMLLGIADTVMVGRAGVVPLAACSLVNAVTHVPMIMGFGILVAAAVRPAQAYGARDTESVTAALRHGLALAFATGLAAAAGTLALTSRLEIFEAPTEVITAAKPYMRLCGWSLLPLMAYHAVKQFAEALNRPRPTMWIIWAGVALNILLNWVFIFGRVGAPALGLEGAGLATLIARSTMAIAALLWLAASRHLAPWRPARWTGPWSMDEFRRLLGIGVPAAAQQGMEVGAFTGAGIMMGWISATALAAHQIAITLASTTFVVALSVAMAVSVRVGHAWGAGLPRRLRQVTGGGLLLGGGFMGICAGGFLLAGEWMAGCFVSSAEVVRLTASLLAIAAFFQIADATQVVMLFATRGMSDVQVPTAITLLAYWVIALPTAWWSGCRLGHGPVGIWFGLAFGLGTAAVLLTWRFLVCSARTVAIPRANRCKTSAGD
jgi:MATE family multidrug resistance protein